MEKLELTGSQIESIVMKPLSDRIEHIVVLMLENRSFANVFGGLYPDLTKTGKFRGLTGEETNPLDPANPSAGSVPVFQAPLGYEASIMPYPDPGELYTDMVEQLFGFDAALPTGVPKMNGFAWNYGKQKAAREEEGGRPVKPHPKHIMQYYSAATMPVSWFLAQQFAVCDTWFASGPVQTIANRIFAHCGTPGVIPGTDLSRVDNPDFVKGFDFEPTVTDLTIFEALDQAHPQTRARGPGLQDAPGTALNWKVYYHDAPVSVFCQYVYNNWHWAVGGNVFHYTDPLWGTNNFEEDIVNNVLPKYSFIEPRYTDALGGSPNTNHPGGAGIDFTDPNGSSLPPPIDVRAGEQLLCEIYSILCSHPDVFAKTLLVVTYDEHGGLYDNVSPPCAASPFVQPVSNFPYNRFGVRVPTILINPYIAPGTVYPPRAAFEPVSGTPFDHTSLIQTALQQFGVSGDFGPRVDAAPPISKTGLLTETYNPPPACAAPAYAAVESLRPRAAVEFYHPKAPGLAGALGGLYIEEQKRRATRAP